MRLEAKVALEWSSVGISYRYVAWLHWDEFFVGFKIVVFGQDFGTDKLFLENLDEVEQILGIRVANVIYGVWWNREAVFPVFFLWGFGYDAHDTLDDVADVGEVALAIAIVEDFDSFALDKFVGKTEVGHIWAAGRAVDCKEAEAGSWNVVELAIAVRKEFIALLGGSVEADGIVYFVVGTKWDFSIAAIDGAGRGIDEMLDGIIAASLEDVIKTNDVGFDISIRMIDAIAHAGLGGKVNDDIEVVFFEQFIN